VEAYVVVVFTHAASKITVGFLFRVTNVWDGSSLVVPPGVRWTLPYYILHIFSILSIVIISPNYYNRLGLNIMVHPVFSRRGCLSELCDTGTMA